MEWNSLKASDKSRIIRTAVEHGITDLEEVKSLWRQSVEQPEMYDDGGILYDNGTQSPDNPPMGRANPDNWREYMDWAYAASSRLSKEWDEPESFIFFDMLNSNDYDYKAFYDEDPERAWQWLESPEGSHFDDVGKTVYHPSFSDESMYSANNYGDMGTGANPDNITGPSWNDNNQLIDQEGNVVFDENTYAEGGPVKRANVDDWMANWYANRTEQLVSNYNDYYQIPHTWDPEENANRGWEIQDILSKALIETKGIKPRNIPFSPDIHGYSYNDGTGEKILLNYGESDDVLLHEKTHALNSLIGDHFVSDDGMGVESSSPIYSNIDVTPDDLYEDGYGKYEWNEYLDDPNEVYSRLMQIRYLNRMLPNKKYSLEDIRRMRKEGRLGLEYSDGLERYTNEFIQYLFNDIAANTDDSGLNYLKYGGLKKKGGIMDGPDDPPSVKVDYKYHFDRATGSNIYPKQFEYNENAPDIPDNPYVDYDLLWKNNTSIGNKRKMNRTNMEQVDNYLVQKGVPLYQRQAILYTILQESGGDSLGAHGNGYYGLVGWSPERYNRIKDKSLIGQTEYLYNTLYNGNGDSDWGHGGAGTGYQSWTDAKNAFINADNVNTAIWALTHGYIRPAADVRKYRTENGPKHFSKGGSKESYKNRKLFKIN